MLPPTYLLASIVAMVALRFLLPGWRIVAFPWPLLGLVPAAGGLALSVVADQAFKKHRTTVKPFEESTALVTSGAYAISRHKSLQKKRGLPVTFPCLVRQIYKDARPRF